ncbi:hypothetical protein Tco_1473001, partial [Tanacetum coccineum]
PTPPSPPPFPLSPLYSPLLIIPSPPIHTSPTYASAPLGYKAAMVQLRAASPLHVSSPPLLLASADCRSDIPKTNMPFRKKLCLTTLASRFNDTIDASIRASESRVMTAVEEVNKRVADLATTHTRFVLRSLGSILTSVYAAVQKLKKKVYNAGKRFLYVKRNKAIFLGKGASKVGIKVQQISLKDYTWYLRGTSALNGISTTHWMHDTRTSLFISQTNGIETAEAEASVLVE